MDVMNLPKLEIVGMKKFTWTYGLKSKPKLTKSDSAYDSSEDTNTTSTENEHISRPSSATSGLGSLSTRTSFSETIDTVSELESASKESSEIVNQLPNEPNFLQASKTEDISGVFHSPDYFDIEIQTISANTEDIVSLDEEPEVDSANKQHQNVAMPMLWELSNSQSLENIPDRSEPPNSPIPTEISSPFAIATFPDNMSFYGADVVDGPQPPDSCLESTRKQLLSIMEVCRRLLRL